MFRIYLYAAATALAVGAMSAVYYAGYRAGGNAARLRVALAVERQQAREARLVQQIEAARRERKIVYQERIRVVKDAADPAGCLDRPLPPAVLDSLRDDRRG